MLVHTEAIVLRSVPYKETTRMVTLYTLELGKVTILARGAQSIKSPFGATLQLLSHINAILYTRPTRSIQILSDCSHIAIYPEISDNLERLAIGQHICELMLSLTEEGQNSPEIFQLLVKTLGALNTQDMDAIVVKLCFQLQFTSLLGFAPAFSKKSVEELDDSGGHLVLEDGTITNHVRPEESTMFASKGVLRGFAILHRANFDVAVRLRLSLKQRKDLYHLVTRFMQYHVQDAYPDRGQKVIDQLLNRT